MAASTSLRSRPGIKGPSACAIIAELGVDMSAFQSPAHLVSWAVLKPRNDESAGMIKSRRITHGNKYLRKTMIECAWQRAEQRATTSAGSVTIRQWSLQHTNLSN